MFLKHSSACVNGALHFSLSLSRGKTRYALRDHQAAYQLPSERRKNMEHGYQHFIWKGTGGHRSAFPRSTINSNLKGERQPNWTGEIRKMKERDTAYMQPEGPASEACACPVPFCANGCHASAEGPASCTTKRRLYFIYDMYERTFVITASSDWQCPRYCTRCISCTPVGISSGRVQLISHLHLP